MLGKTADKGLKAVLQQAKATLFPAPKPHDTMRLEDARQRSTEFLTGLDNLLARSKASLEERDIRL